MKTKSSSGLGLARVAWPFVLIIVVQTLLATFSLQMASALRAFVAGESYWSKGQHDSLYYLARYISSGEPEYLDDYAQAMAVPLGDRQARLALEAELPDLDAAFNGFIQGRNRPEDVLGLIWLIRDFSWFYYMKASINDWRNAEAALLEVDDLANAIGDPTKLSDDQRRDLLLELDRINGSVTPLADRFSERMGEGVQFVQKGLLASNIALAFAFILLTVLRLNAFLRQRKSIEGQLYWGAHHDQLTGLPNRRLFEKELSKALQEPGSPHALIFLDLDRFKAVNDTGGHAAGDQLLKQVATEISKGIRNTDLLARLGGDEFALVLYNCSAVTALSIANCIRATVESLDFVWNGQHYSVGASIGVVHLDCKNMAIDEALRAADIACYVAKENGRNRVHLFKPSRSEGPGDQDDLGSPAAASMRQGHEPRQPMTTKGGHSGCAGVPPATLNS